MRKKIQQALRKSLHLAVVFHLEYDEVPNGVERMRTQSSSNAFILLMGKYGQAGEPAIADIRAGFPVTVLQDTSKFFDLSLAQIRKIVGVPNTTAHNWTRQNANMDSAASERVWRMADVAVLAIDVFGGEEGAKLWLTTPNRLLQGSSPLEFLDTEPGAIAVRQILNAIATGGPA